MEIIIPQIYADNYTETTDFQNVSVPLQDLYKAPQEQYNKTVLDPRNESFLNYESVENYTEVYWLDDNLTNLTSYMQANTSTDSSSEMPLVTMVLLTFFLTLLIVATVVGNVFVIAAIFLDLVAIALDRYWAVTNVDYVRQRSSRRIGGMIFLIWAVGVLVSFAPVLGWKDEDFLFRIEQDKRCLVSQDAGYQIFATCSSFYAPLVIILILYWRIFQVARKRIRHKPGAKSCVQPKEKPMVHMVTHDNKSSPSTQITEATSATNNGIPITTDVTPPIKTKKKPTRENMEAKRERKAAKTLAIITGIFVVCWLPFFITALLMAVCRLPACEPNPYLFDFFLWLGYANSMLNPIIYTIFSPDFRSAFQRVLCGKKRGRIY